MLLTNEVYQKEDNNSPTPDGSDFVQSLKKYILHEDSVICTPHKVAGPESNDLVYQLRQHGIDRVFLAGVLSNVCVESHMRSLIENGFQTAVVYDATAATSKDDFNAAMTNYKAFATLVCTTDQAIAEM
ncbi:cysteine hydrolase family protein [Geomicrobium sp. JCM 19055]|uniref:cysteine hydrolase family protein n=1 Tax=Geomicrobium sp. JCM 19055 TaxID=1460649 RepID=UPI00351C11FD